MVATKSKGIVPVELAIPLCEMDEKRRKRVEEMITIRYKLLTGLAVSDEQLKKIASTAKCYELK